MATKSEVERFLNDFKTKMSIYQIIFLDDRGKNAQALLDLDMSPISRKETITKLKVEDYSEGPLDEKMRGILPMWVFGKIVKSRKCTLKSVWGLRICRRFVSLFIHPSIR